jgi:3-hydroxybutyryl-CoA dehydrogenase
MNDISAPPSTTIAIVGLGLMGRGIATCLLGHSFRVIGCDLVPAAHEIADSYIDRGLREMQQHAGLDKAVVDSWRSRYHATTAYRDWPPCDFVVESIDENLDAKRSAFEQIEEIVGASVPIGSNTSAIPISELQTSRKHPERFFGMHWFEPAYATRFLELIPGAETSFATIEKAVEVARQCEKEPSVLAKDIPGFIVNRLGYAVYREALNLLELGVADAATIDRSFRNACGVWSTIFGPFEWIDLTGGPELYGKAMQRVLPTLSNASKLPEALLRLSSAGAHGIANGRGFYNYTESDAERIDALFHAHAWRARQMMNEYRPLETNQSATVD